VNDVLVEEMPKAYTEYDYLTNSGIGKLIDVSIFNKIISVLPNYDSIDNLNSIGKITKILDLDQGVKFDSDTIAIEDDQGKLNNGFAVEKREHPVKVKAEVKGLQALQGVQGVHGEVGAKL
jgi:hypothetical protein